MIQRGKKLEDLKGTDETKKGSGYDSDLYEKLEESERDMWLGLLALAVVSIIATAIF